MRDKKNNRNLALCRMTLAVVLPFTCANTASAQLRGSNDGWFTVDTSNSSTAFIPATPVIMEASKDLIEKGMTQDMVVSLIGRPDEVYWDNDKQTLYHATYKYQVYKCSFSFSFDSKGNESSGSDITALYSADAKVYFHNVNGEWLVYKVIGSTTNYNEYRNNNYNPIRRMSEPDGSVLIRRYKSSRSR